MRKLLRRLSYFRNRRQMDADLAEEMDFHRALLDRDGAAPATMGNRAIAREDARGVWIWPWLESLWQDAAYAGRNFRRQPGLAAVVIVLLGAVIGLHTTLATV